MEMIQLEKQEAVSAIMRGERVPDPCTEHEVQLVEARPDAFKSFSGLVKAQTAKMSAPDPRSFTVAQAIETSLRKPSDTWLDIYPGPEVGHIVRCFPMNSDEKMHLGCVREYDRVTGYLMIEGGPCKHFTTSMRNWLSNIFPARLDPKPLLGMEMATKYNGRVRYGVIDKIEDDRYHCSLTDGMLFWFMRVAWMDVVWPHNLRERAL
jgi:hypothetical protein